MENTSSVEMIGRDTPCCRCGYNLRGLGVEGRCPECGEAVEVSRAGRHLAVSDPRWRRRLRLGAAMHACALVGFLLILLDLINGHVTVRGLELRYILMAVAVSLGAGGAWLQTSSEPGGPYFDDARWLRGVVRGLAALSWSGMVGYAMIQTRGWTIPSYNHMVLWQNITGIMAFGSLPMTGLAIWHISQLAKRMDAQRLVFYGRLSAISPAIVVGVIIGIISVVRYLLADDPPIWLGMLLYAILFLWPALYQMIWCDRVELIGRETS